MRARRVRLVTVRAGAVSRDLAVAADAPVTHLVPVLVTALGLADDAAVRPAVWARREERWRPLQVNRTLDDAGVVDGETLHLSAQAPAEEPGRAEPAPGAQGQDRLAQSPEEDQ